MQCTYIEMNDKNHGGSPMQRRFPMLLQRPNAMRRSRCRVLAYWLTVVVPNAKRRCQGQDLTYRLMIKKNCIRYKYIDVDDENREGRPMRRRLLILWGGAMVWGGADVSTCIQIDDEKNCRYQIFILRLMKKAVEGGRPMQRRFPMLPRSQSSMRSLCQALLYRLMITKCQHRVLI